MLTNSDKNGIIYLSTRGADLLCQNSPLVCAAGLNRSSGRRRTRAFLSEGSMIKGKCYNTGKTHFKKGHQNSEITKQKIRNKVLGKKRSLETKLKISLKNKGKHLSLLTEFKKKELHPYWKGDNAKYVALHNRVEREKGKPKFCEVCKTDSNRKKYHWANLTGDYTNIMDYKRMCCKCHRQYDKKRRLI